MPQSKNNNPRPKRTTSTSKNIVKKTNVSKKATINAKDIQSLSKVIHTLSHFINNSVIPSAAKTHLRRAIKAIAQHIS